MTNGKEIPVIHDLFSREIRPIRNWYEFLKRWNAVETLEEMLGLLHFAFSIFSFDRFQHDEVSCTPEDRLIFLLSLADGWDDSSRLYTRDDRGREYSYGKDRRGYRMSKSPSDIRQVVASKAFDQLCLNFFRLEKDNERLERNWFQIVFDDTLFPVIQDFFRVEGLVNDDREVKIRNLNRWGQSGNNEKLAVAFLLELANFLWNFQEAEVDSWRKEEAQAEIVEMNRSRRIRVNSAKLWMLEILSFLDRLEVLDKRILHLSHDEVTKLEDIAMRAKIERYHYPVKKDRQVETLDEAYLVGSKAAELLKRRELTLRELERLEGISQAEEALEEAQRELNLRQKA